MAVEEGRIRYRKNGLLLYSSTVVPVFPLLVDTSIYSPGSALRGVILGGTLESVVVAQPVFAPPEGLYTGPQDVVIATSTPNAVIRYTTDGSDPTEASAVYSSAVRLEAPTVLRARAWKAGYLPSEVAVGTYGMQLEAPVASPPGGLFSQAISVTFSASPDAVVRYTTDGSDPTEASALYAGPLSVAAATDLAARAFEPGWSPSPVTREAYRFQYGTLAPPVIVPTPGTYVTSVSVTLSGPPGASVRYTTDGSTPTAASPLYEGPFTLTGSATVRAASFEADWTPSVPAEAVYEIKVATPSFAPPSGSYFFAQDVAIETSTPGATITYTTDGAEPTRSDPTLAPGQTVGLDGPVTLRSRAWKDGATPSDIASATYRIAGGHAAVAGGGDHSLALTDGGDVWAWGHNAFGQVGDGTVTQRLTAVRVPLPNGVSGIAAGTSHSLARTTDGSLWAWGYNGHGELGDGSTTERLTPVQVPGMSGVVSMDGGQFHSVAAKGDGTVWTWGYNGNGQLGDGTATQRTSPVQVGVVSGVVLVSAGAAHTLAVRNDGTVWAWGYNEHGELGDGTTAQRPSPVQVAGLANVVAVAGGQLHSVALKGDGTVWAWGSNGNGQLGDGTLMQHLAPVQVAGLTNVVAVAGQILTRTR